MGRIIRHFSNDTDIQTEHLILGFFDHRINTLEILFSVLLTVLIVYFQVVLRRLDDRRLDDRRLDDRRLDDRRLDDRRLDDRRLDDRRLE